MSMTRDPFEDSVFHSLSAKPRTASARPLDTAAALTERLNFASLEQRCGRVHVAFVDNAYHVQLPQRQLMSDVQAFLAQDNPEINLDFTEDMYNYEPNEDLIRKSPMPLWVIKPTGDRSVTIQRIW